MRFTSKLQKTFTNEGLHPYIPNEPIKFCRPLKYLKDDIKNNKCGWQEQIPINTHLNKIWRGMKNKLKFIKNKTVRYLFETCKREQIKFTSYDIYGNLLYTYIPPLDKRSGKKQLNIIVHNNCMYPLLYSFTIINPIEQSMFEHIIDKCEFTVYLTNIKLSRFSEEVIDKRIKYNLNDNTVFSQRICKCGIIYEASFSMKHRINPDVFRTNNYNEKYHHPKFNRYPNSYNESELCTCSKIRLRYMNEIGEKIKPQLITDTEYETDTESDYESDDEQLQITYNDDLTKIICPCGSIYTNSTSHKKRHELTHKHINFIFNITQ